MGAGFWPFGEISEVLLNKLMITSLKWYHWNSYQNACIWGSIQATSWHRIWMVWGWKPGNMLRQVHNVWSWLEINVSCHQRCSLQRCVLGGGMAGWRGVWMCGGWNNDHSSGHCRREFDMNGLFCKGVLPRGLHSDYTLRVNRYSVHTLSITQLLFFVWAVMLACIHHCHAFIIISSMFFTYTHWSWLFQSWSNLASLQDSPHGGP